MKRLLRVITIIILSFSIMGTSIQAKAMTLEQAAVLVEKTNEQINKDIQNAVEQANDLVLKYHDAIINASNADDAQKVKNNIDDVVNALHIISQSYNVTTESKEAINNIKGLDNNLILLKNDVIKINKKDSSNYDNSYIEFNMKLDKIIYDLIEKTNKKAEKLRVEAAKSGIIIESEWISVNIGGRNVLIDPCRVIGF